MTTAYQTVSELQTQLGARLRRLRLQQNLTVKDIAAKSGLAEKSVRNLESGQGSTTGTLIGVLRALDAVDWLAQLAPEPFVDPMAMLNSPAPRQRASRRRKKATD